LQLKPFNQYAATSHLSNWFQLSGQLYLMLIQLSQLEEDSDSLGTCFYGKNPIITYGSYM